MINIDNNKHIFEAKPLALILGTRKTVKGSLFADFCSSESSNKFSTEYQATGRYYIREYSHIKDSVGESYTDYLIDPETLMDISDPQNPVLVDIHTIFDSNAQK